MLVKRQTAALGGSVSEQEKSNMRKTFEFPIEASLDSVLDTYMSTEFFIETMRLAGARSVEILEERDLEDGGRSWKAKITDTGRLPEFLRTSDIVVIINESSFHPSERKLVWQIMPAVQQRLIQLNGEIRIAETDGGVTLTYDASLDIHIPLLGRKTESLGLQIIGKECAKQAAFLSKWINKSVSV